MKKLAFITLFLIIFIGLSQVLFAHCDSRNGPVVKAAMEALKTNNVNLVLIWVQPGDEEELKTAFAQTIAVRKKDMEVKELADEYFLETVVRLHRKGEGESYSGIKSDAPEAFVLSAERALKIKSADSILYDLDIGLRQKLDHYLSTTLNTADYDPSNVKAGRAYVANYIQFLHYVETLYSAATKETIEHRAHEGSANLVKEENTVQQASGTQSADNSFHYLLFAVLMVLGLLLIIVLLQNKKLNYRYRRHDF